MKTKLLLFAILCLSFSAILSQKEDHDHDHTFAFKKGDEQTIVYTNKSPKLSTDFWKPNASKDVDNNYNLAKPAVNSSSNKITKKTIWRVFDYMNKGYFTSDARCKTSNVSMETGCCIRGSYYEEEKCWISLISITILSTSLVVGLLFFLLTISCCLCCACVKKWRRQRLLEMKKKLALNTPNAQSTAPSRYSQISSNSVAPSQPVQQPKPQVDASPKCNCPKKHAKVEAKSPVPVIKTTNSNDFYQPPKLVPSKPQQNNSQVELNSHYPKLEEVVTNPYPRFVDMQMPTQSKFFVLNHIDNQQYQTRHNNNDRSNKNNAFFDINTYY